MKKIIMSFCIILLVFSLVACKQSPETNKLTTDTGQYTKFTKEEVDKAIDTVKNNFDFPAATLTKIWYDEDKSDSLVTLYLETGKGLASGIKPENTIVLLSSFDVDDSGENGNPVLDPGTYTDYQWVLIRDNPTSNWRIDDRGY